MGSFFKKLLGSADAVARPLAQTIVRAAVQQALADATKRAQARHGNSVTGVAVGTALGELARDIEAYAHE